MQYNRSNYRPQINTPWIIYPGLNPSPSASIQFRLFCFPYAGGGAIAFRDWKQELPSNVDLACVQLPGRENRMAESLLYHLPDVIQKLKPAILPHLTLPFAFFGHSMGALIAFEMARSLRQTHRLPLKHLFVSGCRAPHLPRHNPPRHTLSDVDLVSALQLLEGTPEAVLKNAELMALLLPIIRADLSVADTYTYYEQKPLSLPITAIGGSDDPEVSPEQLIDWETQTTSNFSYQLFSGGHFFIQQEWSLIIKLMLNQCH